MKPPHRIVWNRLDRLVGPFTISVVAGKFIGDGTAHYLREGFVPIWMLQGLAVSLLLFILWPLLEQFYDDYLTTKE